MKTHLSLRVSNIQKSIEFYSAFFGVAPHKVRPGYANFDLENPPLKFAKSKITLNTIRSKLLRMKTFTAVVEKCPRTGLFVGYVPGFVGAHSQGETLDELHRNLQEVIEMLLEDGEPELEAEFVGTQTVAVAA
jgi:predicted RNase H-like HicB family nuclease